MKLSRLTIKDKPLFERHLKKKEHSLSYYSFEQLVLWLEHFDILWALVNEKLCIFFKNAGGCFMILPPLGAQDTKTVGQCFDYMESINNNTEVTRIENIEEPDIGFYKSNKFKVYEKSKEYIVNSLDMASLQGEKFKHKRNLVNFFMKSGQHNIRQYEDADRAGVLKLYKEWMADRHEKNTDVMFQAMLEDSYKVLESELKIFKELDYQGVVVDCDGKIIAFSSGYPVTNKLFCINFEIADLNYKGLPQFIFSRFSGMISKSFAEINVMDDSGIENILRTKLSYKPVRTASSYTALMI